MKNVFTCPCCQAVLNPSVKILLKVSYKKKHGMILLSPQPGNFKFICDKSVSDALKPGSTITFSCPVCTADLTSPASAKLVELNLVGPAGVTRKVHFSRIYGTHATYVIDGDEITSYGDDADDLNTTNFFGA